MAKRKASTKKSGKGTPVLKIILITVGVLFLGFLLLMQTVRMGVFGELPTEEELGAILSAQDRSKAGLTAPACGLFLETIYYAPPIFQSRVRP